MEIGDQVFDIMSVDEIDNAKEVEPNIEAVEGPDPIRKAVRTKYSTKQLAAWFQVYMDHGPDEQEEFSERRIGSSRMPDITPMRLKRVR